MPEPATPQRLSNKAELQEIFAKAHSVVVFSLQQVTRAEAYIPSAHQCPDKTLSSFTVMNSALTSQL